MTATDPRPGGSGACAPTRLRSSDAESWRRSAMLYIGPDALMPFASAVAAVFGMLLMFWRRFFNFLRISFRAIGRRLGGRGALEP